MTNADSTLSGKRIWVTRPAHQAAELYSMIEQQQGVPVLLPTLVIRPAVDKTQATAGERHLADADIVIFISRNAVVYALERFPGMADTMQGKTVLAVGQATARSLTALGLDKVAHVGAGGSDALLQLTTLAEAGIRAKRIVIVRGQGGREALRDALLARGAVVDYVEVYRRDKPDLSQAEMAKFWHDQSPDAVVITSMAGLDNLVELTPAAASSRLLETPMVVMSERIGQHARNTGFVRVATATDNTDGGLIDALLNMSENALK